MYDVIIIGAGPSGLNAAKILAKKNLNVLVLEKKNKIEENIVCTGIVGREVFEEFDISRESILKEINKIKLVSPNLNSIVYRHNHSFAYIVDRKKFDRNLSQEAQSQGVKIEIRNEVVDIIVHKNRIEVLTKIKGKNHKKYFAHVGIIATGLNYKLHRKLKLGYPKDFLHGVQTEIKIDNIDYTHIFVGRNIAPGAFAWLVPVGNNKVRLGLITEKDPMPCFDNLLEKIYSNKIININKSLVQYKAIAQGLVSQTFGERILAVGEAAGQVKTSTGGGIYYGMLCSKIASRVLIERFKEKKFSKEALAEYERLWKKVLQKEILIGYYARKIFSRLNDSQIERIFRIAKTDGVFPMIREKGNFDWHSELILMLIKRLPLLRYIKGKKTTEKRRKNQN